MSIFDVPLVLVHGLVVNISLKLCSSVQISRRRRLTFETSLFLCSEKTA